MVTRRQLADALRVLAMDAIEKAKSGHPGAPMGMADMGEALWRHCLHHNPQNPFWVNRDRFVLSNGHASMLLYGLLHLTGYDLPMDEIKNFRQLGSRTPGHPELGLGVEMTTGPLGQGVASSVGMALAERMLAREFNRPEFPIVDHYTYCFCGDGCLMEGVASEACSLAGTLRLGKLILFYDDNGISIDGKVTGWFDEDVNGRFTSYHWQVIGPGNGHDPDFLDSAINAAKKDDRPTLIVCRTHIGLGSTKQDSSACHGAPLGEEAIRTARESYGWDADPFVIPEEIRKEWDFREEGARLEKEWNDLFSAYTQRYPSLAREFLRRMHGELPPDCNNVFTDLRDAFFAQEESLATRKASLKCLEAFQAHLPEMIGGSADLTSSVGAKVKSAQFYDPKSGEGNFIAYGVREFAMNCMVNGFALHGGFLPFAGTFLAFSDQGKNAVRLGALMQLHAIFIYTHDSIGVGEDGPTHQPIEQMTCLRSIPNLYVFRPCDSIETAYAWQWAITHKKTSALVFSRQTLPYVKREKEKLDFIEKGGYILRDSEREPELILLTSGSEVSLGLACYEALTQEGYAIRLVSMPCCELFEEQESAYKESVLPGHIRKRLAIEASARDFWWKYVGLDGDIIGLTGFGVSAPAADVFSHFGFTKENVIERAKKLLNS